MYQKIKIGNITFHLTQNVLPDILDNQGLPTLEADYVHDIDNKQCADLTIDIVDNRLAAIYTGTPEQLTTKIKNNNDKIAGKYPALTNLLNLGTTQDILPLYQQYKHLLKTDAIVYQVKTWCWNNQSKELIYDYLLGLAAILADHNQLEPNRDITEAITSLLAEYDETSPTYHDILEFAKRNEILIKEQT